MHTARCTIVCSGSRYQTLSCCRRAPRAAKKALPGARNRRLWPLAPRGSSVVCCCRREARNRGAAVSCAAAAARGAAGHEGSPLTEPGQTGVRPKDHRRRIVARLIGSGTVSDVPLVKLPGRTRATHRIADDHIRRLTMILQLQSNRRSRIFLLSDRGVHAVKMKQATRKSALLRSLRDDVFLRMLVCVCVCVFCT